MGIKETRFVESVLFSASKPVSINEIKEVVKLDKKKIKIALDALIENYNVKRKNDTSMEIIRAGDKYTMQIKEKFLEKSASVTKPLIQDNLLKTLALIAFHQPIKQSNLRRMIGQKIYNQVDELHSMKLINTKKHGSTEMLTTTKLFPEYFGIDTTKPEEIRDFLVKKVVGNISKFKNQEK